MGESGHADAALLALVGAAATAAAARAAFSPAPRRPPEGPQKAPRRRLTSLPTPRSIPAVSNGKGPLSGRGPTGPFPARLLRVLLGAAARRDRGDRGVGRLGQHDGRVQRDPIDELREFRAAAVRLGVQCGVERIGGEFRRERGDLDPPARGADGARRGRRRGARCLSSAPAVLGERCRLRPPSCPAAPARFRRRERGDLDRQRAQQMVHVADAVAEQGRRA